jgi:hypothetical protein
MMHSERGTGTLNPIAAYARTHAPALGAICHRLQAEIDKAIPKATSKMWHGGPVWFIGENPIVGYRVGPKGVDLTFWSGQLFEEPLLQATGKDKAAHVSIRDASEIDVAKLRRWLRSARTVIFDYVGMYARKRETARRKP